MPVIGYKLCGEEQSPQELIDCARRAEEVGFDFAMISDHYHPWIDICLVCPRRPLSKRRD